jgi:hypothetical protein
MQNTQTSTLYPQAPTVAVAPTQSAVSWGAVIAGAVIAAAVSAMLITGGSGLGLLSMSPWQRAGASGAALAVGSIVWLLATQIIAYGIAGYVAGRLRTRWTDAARDEIYFRDTAHGFLVWALSAVVGLALLGSTVASVVSGTAKAGATLAGAGVGATLAGQATREGMRMSPLDYYADALLRPDDPLRGMNGSDAHNETRMILAHSMEHGRVSDQDRPYLVKLIAQRAGVDQAAAQQRLTRISDQARQAEQQARVAVDAARKAAAAFSLWAFASLLIGAFVASLAATIGGRARDR